MLAAATSTGCSTSSPGRAIRTRRPREPSTSRQRPDPSCTIAPPPCAKSCFRLTLHNADDVCFACSRIMPEATTHGVLPWTPADRQRRVLVLRYQVRLPDDSPLRSCAKLLADGFTCLPAARARPAEQLWWVQRGGDVTSGAGDARAACLRTADDTQGHRIAGCRAALVRAQAVRIVDQKMV